MRITSESSDAAVLEELGSRLSRHRLNRNQTQESLASQAGVSQRTVIRIERGRSAQFSSLVRVMRALDLLDNMEALVPAPPLSPIQQVRLHGKRRRRASSPRGAPAKAGPWHWGDEQ